MDGLWLILNDFPQNGHGGKIFELDAIDEVLETLGSDSIDVIELALLF